MRASRWDLTFLGGLLLLVTAPIAALDPHKLPTQYRIDSWTTRQGLPQNSVEGILQTTDGYLWLATQEGLVRFDGVAFTVFDRTNSPGIRQNRLTSLCQDTAGNLWIGTRGAGLVRHRDGVFAPVDKSAGLPSNIIRDLLATSDGAVWVATDAGAVRISGDTVTRFAGTDGLPAEDVRTIAQGKDSLWIGTGTGLWRLAAGKFEQFDLTAAPSREIQAVVEDREGALWIGTPLGLVRFFKGSWTVFTTNDGLPSSDVGALFQDRDGLIWVGTVADGVARWDGRRFAPFTSGDGLLSDSVRSFGEDKEGSLWIGTGTGGLNRLANAAFTPLTRREGLSGRVTDVILEDRDGSIWIGTQNQGLNRYSDGKFTVFRKEDGLSNNAIRSLYEARNGDLWIGTRSGLNRFRNGQFTVFSTPDGLPHDEVRAITEDPEGNLWVGTQFGGIARLRDGQFTTFSSMEGLPSKTIRALHVDRHGSLWAGTLAGLARFEKGRFVPFGEDQGLFNDVIFVIHEESDGTLWLGTNGGGLRRLKDGQVRRITTAEGLFDDTVAQILEDGSGNFWISCYKGIFRVSKEELDAVADGKATTVHSTIFGTADGMKNAECTGGPSPAGWKARDGRLWFPTIDGVVVVDPQNISLNSSPPPVFIERVVTQQGSWPLSSPLVFDSDTRNLEFHYTALSFLVPEKVRFRYKLAGFDPGWIEAGNRRTAYYTHLPPGQYQFVVIACNNDGVWNETGASVRFVLEPHFTQTWAFYGLVVFGVGLVAFGLYRLRIRSLRARERLLMEMVEQRTESLRLEKARSERAMGEAEEASRMKSRFLASTSHELRTPLNAIIGYTEMMTEDAQGRDLPEFVDDLEKVGGAARHLLGLINDILDLSKIEAGKLEFVPEAFLVSRLIDDAATTVKPLAARKANEFQVRLPETPLEMTADVTRVRQVLLNLFSNAAKFTEKGVISLEVRASNDGGDPKIVFEVRDTGIGMSPDQISRLFEPFSQAEATTANKYGGTGLGLAISRRLCQMMGGDLTVTSALGQGSTFTATLPITPIPHAPVLGRLHDGSEC